MIPFPASFAAMVRQGGNPDLRRYEQLFRSPLITESSCSSPSLVSPIVEPTPLCLNENNFHSNAGTCVTSDRKVQCKDSISRCKADTDAALLLTSIKKLHVEKEPIHPAPTTTMGLSHVPKLLLSTRPTTEKADDFSSIPSTYSKLRSVIGPKTTVLLGKDRKKPNAPRTRTLPSAPSRSRARTVSLDLNHLPAPPRLINRTADASYRIPKEKITLDLTTDVTDSSGKGPAQISPPASPVLQSIRDLKRDQGPRRLALKKRSADAMNAPTTVTAATSIASASVESNKKRRKQQHKPRPSMLRPKDSSSASLTTKSSSDSAEKKVLRKKFSWKSYPELEDFLIANREEYLRHSAMNYTSQQKEYNNRLTERLLELASDCGYVFDEESFSFVSIRDRIRCYFKSYVQSKKKRGLILGYAARRKGLISEEELEKSAGIKGTIVVPKTSTVKKSK